MRLPTGRRSAQDASSRSRWMLTPATHSTLEDAISTAAPVRPLIGRPRRSSPGFNGRCSSGMPAICAVRSRRYTTTSTGLRANRAGVCATTATTSLGRRGMIPTDSRPGCATWSMPSSEGATIYRGHGLMVEVQHDR